MIKANYPINKNISKWLAMHYYSEMFSVEELKGKREGRKSL